MTTTYADDCAHAATQQGIAAIALALAVREIPATIEQTGGMTMVATVHLPDDTVLTFTQDGPTTLAAQCTSAQWEGTQDVEDQHVHEFPTLTDAVTWAQTRRAHSEATAWLTLITRVATGIGLTGERTRTGADGEVEVEWTWPSGNPHCAITMSVDECCGPTFNVRAYDDQDYAEPHFERTVHDPRAVLHALADARRIERSVPYGIASDHDGEQSVVVVFDVFATTHHDAAVHVLRRLTDAELTGHDIDAFWFPEPQDKPIDGNDRDAMTLRPLS